MNTIKIGKKTIGYHRPCFIIAEAGVNHNGQYELAKKLVDVAITAGADAVKFQTYTTEGLVTKEITIAEYAKHNIGRDMRQIDMLKQYELSHEEFTKLKKYCDTKNILFLSTPHSFDAIDFLENLVPAYKFGSGDITNIPALEYAAKKGKPMILGTGMSTLEEVRSAVQAITSVGNTDIIALHCTTNYPCPLEEVNLRAMLTLQSELDCLVGYSDHTIGLLVPAIAVALGASVIEKHFTFDKKLPGPDHRASLEPADLRQMVVNIRNVEKALGVPEKKPVPSEYEIMQQVRKSVVAGQDIKKGSRIQREMLQVKRPGTGLSPADMHKLVGKKTKQDIMKDEMIQLDMVE
ncbi:MAG: N-acetylneuraminate synthase [Methanobacteriota archaeon]